MYHHKSYGTTNLVETPLQKHENSYSLWYDHHQEGMESDDSGAASPHPLLLRRRDDGLMSPESRAEAIVRGQWELMEMVRNMPESSYELSLKDIVEHNRSVQTSTVVDHQSVEPEDHKNQGLQQRSVVKRDHDQSKKVERNLSLENKGLFLNMVFPFSFKSKKKKVKSKSSVKVSPKPEKDWWKRKFTGSSDSDSSRISSSSSGATGSGGGGGDMGGRKRNGLLSVCWPFFYSRSTTFAE